MTTLVGYASRYGATRGIAERIADTLASLGHPAQARPVQAIGDLARYDAYVIGSAAYMGSWLREAREFVRINQKLLTSHRAARLIPAARVLMPEGHFRNWADIDAWATSIPSELVGVLEPALA